MAPRRSAAAHAGSAHARTSSSPSDWNRCAAAKQGGDAPLLIRSAFGLLGLAGHLLPDVANPARGEERPAVSHAAPGGANCPRRVAQRRCAPWARCSSRAKPSPPRWQHGRENPALALCSYDMLGEGARTEDDARRYYAAYAQAIEALQGQPGASLHDRSRHIREALRARSPLLADAARAGARPISFRRRWSWRARQPAPTSDSPIDAEEADRLDISLDVIAALAATPRRATGRVSGSRCRLTASVLRLVVDWVAELARATGRRMTLRLVKGAYWDTEIKRAQERGLRELPGASPPRPRRMSATSPARAACSKRTDVDLSAVRHSQRVHPRRHPRARAARRANSSSSGCTAWARRSMRSPERSRGRIPARSRLRAGGHARGSAALPCEAPARKRRQFILRASFPESERAGGGRRARSSRIRRSAPAAPHARSASPHALYRARSRAIRKARISAIPPRSKPCSDRCERRASTVQRRPDHRWQACAGCARSCVFARQCSRDRRLFARCDARGDRARARFALRARSAQWDATPATERAACLERAADLLEKRRDQFLSLLVREAGKTLPDAVRSFARSSTTAAITPPRAASSSVSRRKCADRRERRTCFRCTAAACSSASVPGISRSPSLAGRSLRR